MSRQPTLFDTEDRGNVPAHARHDRFVGAPYVASGTSKAAAERIVGALNELQAVLLRHFREAGTTGLTDEEAQDSTGMNPSTERPRRIELVEKGLVRDSGRQRKTRSGRAAVVWEAVL